MRYKSQILLILSSVLGVTLGVVNTAQAQVIEQHQSAKVTTEFECTGTCSSYSSVSVSQHQSTSSNHHVASHRNAHPAVWRKKSEYGSVRLTWEPQDGTCLIRYTEARRSDFAYATSTSCNEGEITIGGLVPGRNYRFQVKIENDDWSKPIVRIAR
ncbi:fibronectin type III domain-containing protein [Candidatus Woesebacteria bacterium]|nr:fibronectin type III domain-containing protein [Candidatus Woesebacteria bacterium]